MSSVPRLTRAVLSIAAPCLALAVYSTAMTGAATAGQATGISLGVAAGVSPAEASERMFLVMLASSPKQFPGPERHPPGLPTRGLPNMYDIHNQYFDRTNPRIGSLSEYWEEISYGDVTIAGTTADWIYLPWAIQPPLVDPGRDDPTTGPPVDDDLDDPVLRNSPANYFDLNDDGDYTYGAGERFNNLYATTPIDRDGDPNGYENGPWFVEPGSLHKTRHGDPVWKPGERFIDMDGDGRWDGLDEANNEMDWNGDGRPDLLGPWIDLNMDGKAANPSDCIYLQDSDNDGNPDCCPKGPGPTCPIFSCPSARWKGPTGGEVIDCNGNLVPDACDLSPQNGPATPDCQATGWLVTDPTCSLCGTSVGRDESPYEGTEFECTPGLPDGVPDECQFLEIAVGADDKCATPGDIEMNFCIMQQGMFLCTEIYTPLLSRCEFHDVNLNRRLDIVEPFENFLRRWDPCVHDPDVSWANLESERAHWVKVYDPNSPNTDTPLTCSSPAYSFTYGSDSYIRDNYPGQAELCSGSRASCDPDLQCAKQCSISGAICQANSDCPSGQTCVQKQICRTGVEELIAQARIAQKGEPGFAIPTNGRVIYGQHDPLHKLPLNQECRCADGSLCENVVFPGQPPILLNACVAGIHAQFDPPDYWTNVVTTNGPAQTMVYTTKVQAAPGSDGTAAFLDQRTPEPLWYEDAWLDRYGRDGCPNPTFNPASPVGPGNLETVECVAPDWPAIVDGENVPLMVPFDDVDPDVYTPAVNRRFFKANFGGTALDEHGRRVGRGVGWVNCSATYDRSVSFETGPVYPFGFEALCNHAILPEEVNGMSQRAVFFDGWVEHDDLPSSKYHMAGDQRLGEVTSPFGNDIWGEDLGIGVPSPLPPDWIIPAAGPYATDIHGNHGRDAGNLLSMELLTWRTGPPFNDGVVWESVNGPHPYAGPSGNNLGFRDYNLDGLVDMGETRPAGSENYLADSLALTRNDGTWTAYPWNRRRLVEDCVEILDDVIDFDDFVDEVSLARVNCPDGEVSAQLPPQLSQAAGDTVFPSGICSGIVLLPPGSHAQGQFPMAPSFYPIHNEDATDPEHMFPPSPRVPMISWNLFFHDLVMGIGVESQSGTIPTENYQTAYAAHEYLHAWEKFPDLYDYDVFGPEPHLPINCPIGDWDIMANGGLVHPIPVLKEHVCTEWIEPIDLATILVPGVETKLTLPPAEYVRDNSYFFLDNDSDPSERLYFWSAGRGFDEKMPGEGMLILHTDTGPVSEPLAGQSTVPPFTYLVVQADGLHEMEGGKNCGNDGDAWPGSIGATRFGHDTDPPATWYAEDAWTGLDISDIVADGSGSVVLHLSWLPTTIPSLQFISPPSGNSIGSIYRIVFNATDLYGGTAIRLYYANDQKVCGGSGDACTQQADCPAGEVCRHDVSIDEGNANFIGELQNNTPGTDDFSVDWDVSAIPDARYVLFAELIPGVGSGGEEQDHTYPRPGHVNVGDGQLVVDNVNIADHAARLETWKVECMDTGGMEWAVSSSLSQPVSVAHAFTGTPYTSPGGEVTFTITAGPTAFARGDTFTFTTTGITAVSTAVEVAGGMISDAPTAVIHADPLFGPMPLTVVFDGSDSYDPAGGALEFAWDFGDGSPRAVGPMAMHSFTVTGTFTVALRVTSTVSRRVGQSAVDITVTSEEFPIGDWNGDGKTDLRDYEMLAACFDLSGPGTAVPLAQCAEVFDFDGDLDVDLRDFAVFQRVFRADSR